MRDHAQDETGESHPDDVNPSLFDQLEGLADRIDDTAARAAGECLRLWPGPELIDWGQRFLPHYFTHPPSQMHVWLASELWQLQHCRGRHRAVVAPRAGAKTTWVSKLYPLYCVCHDLEHYILLVSDSNDQARQNLQAIQQELEANAELIRTYPRVGGIGPVWNRLSLVTRNGIKIEAAGAGKRLRGRTFGPHRPGLIVVDDLENDSAVRSPAQRDRLWNWFTRALMFVGTADTNVLVVGTALHPDDLLQRLRRTPGWKVRSFQSLLTEPARADLWDQWRRIFRDMERDVDERAAAARAFYESHRADMDAGAQTLWPQREPLLDLMTYREQFGEAAFRSEKQADPQATGNSEWPADYFSSLIWFEEWPELQLRVLALDPSKGRAEINDYSAFVMVGLGVDGLLYVDADIARRDASQVVADGCQWADTFRPQAFALETNQFLQLFETLFVQEAQHRGQLLPIWQINSTINKVVRIRMLTPYLRSGRLRFKSNSRGAELLVEQLRTFPNNHHDDGPDALQMALETLSTLLRPTATGEERAVA